MKDSKIGYYIETPKTKNGKRELPLTERAYQAIQRILKNRGKAQPLIVGGYSNFLFLNREGLPKVAGNYEGKMCIRDRGNSDSGEKAGALEKPVTA